jgi:hypothetical protein
MTYPERRFLLPPRRWALLAAGLLLALAAAPTTTAIAARPAVAAPTAPHQAQSQGFLDAEAEEDGDEEWEDGEEEESESEEDEEFGTEGPLLFPSDCLLHTAEAQVTASSAHDVVRLTIHYTSYTPTDVTVDSWLRGGKGSLQLAGAKQHFAQQGVFQETNHLSDRAMFKVRAARAFIVQLGIPDAPSYCNRYSTQRLTVKHTAGGRTTWSRPE